MDADTVSNVIGILAAGGPHAVIAILVFIIVGMARDRRRLTAELTKRDDKLDKIVEDYFHGNMTLSEALGSLRIVLAEIKAHY